MINPATTRTFHRTLYAGMLQSIVLLKRGDDQRQGTIRSVTLADCRQSMVFRHGETIQGSMSSESRCLWHLPGISLSAGGVAFISPADRIVNINATFGVPGYWQPEANTEIITKLFANMITISCLRVDPPSS